MDGIFEHEVDKVGVGLYELVELLKTFQLTAFLIIEDVKVILRRIELHILDLVNQIGFLLGNFLIALL